MTQRRYDPEAREETDTWQVELTKITWPEDEIKQSINVREESSRRRGASRDKKEEPPEWREQGEKWSEIEWLDFCRDEGKL